MSASGDAERSKARGDAERSKARSAALRHARRLTKRGWQVIAQTVGACLRYRVTGLAAEAAFFAILSLPPLIFGLAGAICFVADRFAVQTITNFRQEVL